MLGLELIGRSCYIDGKITYSSDFSEYIGIQEITTSFFGFGPKTSNSWK
jgi:hypothetical protein